MVVGAAPMKHKGAPSRAARSCIRRLTAISFMPAGSAARSPTRSAPGISSNKASMLSTPMAASMARMSSSVCGMNGI